MKNAHNIKQFPTLNPMRWSFQFVAFARNPKYWESYYYLFTKSLKLASPEK